ncbi:MAG: DNA repair protein RecN [Alphaproteobacteria bacterium]|jgi:DNA repair protein RecN (Recombination protein N)|nr:DNA repair protein RecN [Alphaproteobacteria bacterium]
MLVTLTIRNFVLIEQLSLAFDPGLCALTGETGAGKSILLDALGLALGGRGETGLVRGGADQASVTAEFAPDDAHPAFALLRAQELEAEAALVLRRVIRRDGRSRAYVNDQPVSIGLLRQLGESLVEVHGQFATQGLLDPRTHRGVLDAFGGLGGAAARTAAAWQAWRQAEAARAEAEAEAARARAEEAALREALDGLEVLDPRPGEEAALAETRAMLQHREKLVEAVNGALAALSGERGAESGLGSAHRTLDRVADKAGGRLDAVLAGLDRAAAEAAEAVAGLEAFAADIETDSGELERLEERLFALRTAARKHGVEVDGLAALRERLDARLALIEDQGDALGTLAGRSAEARTAYEEAAAALGAARRTAAAGLDHAVAAELPPLKLDKARFRTAIEDLPESEWGPQGRERVGFVVATNPGAPPGPLNKIASGGELARFMLALKVVLAGLSPVPTLVFDEVDSGISGAVADAVGERLARLGETLQILVVTHSPQVAARAARHLRVSKDTVMADAGELVRTSVADLPRAARREEIARMLSGATITDQARAAADSLMAHQRREPQGNLL